jgi:two-component system, NarL family, response regulator DesR
MGMEKFVRVLVAEDNEDLRAAIVLLIDAEPDLLCVAQTGSLLEILPMATQHDAHVVVLDIELQGESSIRALSGLRAQRPQMRIVIHSGHSHPELIRRTLAAGANAYVAKSGDVDELLRAIRDAIS